MDKPIAIVLPQRERFGPGSAGAISMVVRRLARAPSAHPVTIFGLAFDGPRFDGVTFHALQPSAWLPSGATLRYAVAVAVALRHLAPARIEIHNKPDLARFLLWACPDTPIALFLHNDPRTMRGARSPQARARLAARLDGVAAVSAYVSGLWQDGMQAATTAPLVIPNVLDPAELPAPTPPDARARLILFAGRVVSDKGADAFVDACARVLPALPGWRAAIIGADGFGAGGFGAGGFGAGGFGAGGFGEGGRETPFLAALRPRAAAAGVAMLGYRPHDEVLGLMARAAIVVVPSRWREPFGLTALEAMACGAALACSLRGGLAEVVGDAALLFDPDDPEGAAASLARLACDDGLRAVLAGRGKGRVLPLEVAYRALAALRKEAVFF